MSLQKHFDDDEEMHHKTICLISSFIVLKIQQNPRHLTVHERCKFCTSQIEIIKSTSIYNIIINRKTHMCVSFAHFPQENILND